MIYTGYFAKMKSYPQELRKISIARWTPKGIDIEKYTKLMPPETILTFYKNTGNETDYRTAFNAMLKRLNAKQIYNELDGSILLCYEKPENFCHRHLIADWFNQNGFQCEEYKT